MIISHYKFIQEAQLNARNIYELLGWIPYLSEGSYMSTHYEKKNRSRDFSDRLCKRHPMIAPTVTVPFLKHRMIFYVSSMNQI
jgi:hypothetical protein